MSAESRRSEVRWRAGWVSVALLVAGCVGSGPIDDPRQISDTEQLRRACEAGQPEDVRLDAYFPRAVEGCRFGEDGNLPPADGLITARREDVVELDVPSGGVVCGLDFDFTGADPDLQQYMRYDDHFMMTFDDAVLATNYGPMVSLFPSEDGLRVYSWDALAGYDFDFDNSVPNYCLGQDEGLSDCTIPPPETPGPIALSFQGELVDRLALRALELDRYELALVTTGDNDWSDCSHSAFSATVMASVLTFD